jgi:glycerophosphoryl diester phosphodiesterase
MSSYSMMQAPEGSRARVFVDTPALCGHRGSGRGVVGGLLENTLASHRAAVQAGLGWVEVDARLSRDGVLVARHDPVAEDGRPIAELTAAEADRLGLMRVADLLADLAPEVGVNVEIKSALEDALRTRKDTTAAAVSDLVAGESRRRPMLVSSFDPAAVTIVRERAPMVPAGLLTWGGFPLRKAIPAAVHLGADVVAVHVTSFRLDETAIRGDEHEPSHSVRVAHEAGLQVVAWCPEPAEGDQLIAAGVDCLIVDDAVAAVAHYSR